MPTPATSPIDAVRRFNRFYTQKIGVLRQGLLDSPYSITEVRVLYELAHGGPLIAAALGLDLGLDAGYLSRIVARFVKLHLVERRRSKRDGRQSDLRLTAQGRREFARLNARSAAEIGKLLAHLPVADQQRLTDSMGAVRHLLRKPGEPRLPVTLRQPQPGDLGWVVQRHGALYAREFGWDEEFEALVARIVAEYVEHFDARRERCWIAEMDGHSVGCVFLVQKSRSVAKLRLLLVEPSARGCGVGGRLVAECVAFARRAGYKKITLWTNHVLTAARHIYERAGFKRTKSEPHRSFGHDLVGETWELSLV